MRLTAPISPGCHSPSFGPVTSAFFLPHSTRAASLAPLLFVGVERHLGNGLIAFLGISIFACLPAVLSWIVETPSPPARLKLKGSQTELGGEVEMLPLRGADEHTFSRAHGKRQSSIGGVDLGSREAFIRYTVLAPMLLMITLTIGAEVAYAAWVYTYAIERQGMSPTEAAWLNSLFWSSFTVGRVILTAFAAFFPPAVLLIPTLALASASNLMVLVDPSSSELLWFGTAGAGLGACALFSNSISLLAYYDLSTADTTGALCVACAVGHMTIPNLIGHCIQHTDLGYEALVWISYGANTIGLLLICGVIKHLHDNFSPVNQLRECSYCRVGAVSRRTVRSIRHRESSPDGTLSASD